MICFLINITLEIHWEKIISWKTIYKVVWLFLTYYLKPKARPLSIKKKVQKMFLLFSLYAQLRICGRYFYILLIYFLCAFSSGFKNVLIFMQCNERLNASWSRRGTITVCFLGFSWFLSLLFFFSPPVLHWLSDFSGLSAVGHFVRNQSILLIVFMGFFFLIAHCIRMETETQRVSC